MCAGLWDVIGPAVGFPQRGMKYLLRGRFSQGLKVQSSFGPPFPLQSDELVYVAVLFSSSV